MDPRQLFADERLTGMCVFCGDRSDTRDHVPSRVLLDDPLPANLPVVDACRSCNGRFSQDEEYVACLIDCVISGAVKRSIARRRKVARILSNRPAIAGLLSKSQKETDDGNVVWRPDINRVRDVVLKLARGHIAYELSLPQFDCPEVFGCAPILKTSHDERYAFEIPLDLTDMPSPEIGTRAFIRMRKQWPTGRWDDWIEVQQGRYRYRVGQSTGGNWVEMVLSEYLACRVLWT